MVVFIAAAVLFLVIVVWKVLEWQAEKNEREEQEEQEEQARQAQE